MAKNKNAIQQKIFSNSVFFLNQWKAFFLFIVLLLLIPSPSSALAAIDEWEQVSNPNRAIVNVWVSSSGNVYAVGGSGLIDYYDAASSLWTQLTPGPIEHLIDVWGSSDSDIFVVGQNGFILHYNGSSWTQMTSGTNQRLMNVWGASGTDVFAVGHNGTILHYDGSSWAQMTSGTTVRLWGVWGTSATNVYTVGEEGVILHYDGISWTPIISGTTVRLSGIWGSSENDIYAVGGRGVILHYDGVSLTQTILPTQDWLEDVWGTSSTDIYVAGTEEWFSPVRRGSIFHFDGTNWEAMNTGGSWMMQGIYGSSATDVYAVTYGGPILHYPPRVFEMTGDWTITSVTGSGTYDDKGVASSTVTYTVSMTGDITAEFEYVSEAVVGPGGEIGGDISWKGASIRSIGTCNIDGESHDYTGWLAGDNTGLDYGPTIYNPDLGLVVGSYSTTIFGNKEDTHGWTTDGSGYTVDVDWSGTTNGVIYYPLPFPAASGPWSVPSGTGSGSWTATAIKSFAGQMDDTDIGTNGNTGIIQAVGASKYAELSYDVGEDGTFFLSNYQSNPGDISPKAELGKFLQVDSNVSSLDINWNNMQLRLYYQDEELAASGIDENSLAMYRWGTTQWSVVTETGVNTEENYVWADLEHFSSYTALGDPVGYDFGDAPDPDYPTLFASNGAAHTALGPTLGFNRDTESDGQPSTDADGDDAVGTSDDEDGVIFLGTIVALSDGPYTGRVNIDLENADASSNLLDAWIDFNADGDWDDAGEQIFADYDFGTINGVQTLNFTIPQATGGAVVAGDTYARFRLSTVGGLLPDGLAPDGEVEDYRVNIAIPILIDEWSDNFDEGAQQPWITVDNGENSSYEFNNNRYELYTENSGNTDKSVFSYIPGNAADAIIQARMQKISPILLGGVMLRVNPAENSGYAAMLAPNLSLIIVKTTAGESTTVASSEPYAPEDLDPSDCHIKFAAIDDTLYAKVWNGSLEPDNWLAFTDSSPLSSGAGGVVIGTGGDGMYFSPSAIAFDDVSLTTDVSEFCTFTLLPGSKQSDSTGGPGSFNVDAFHYLCDWTATVDAPAGSWIHTTSSGTGNGMVNYTVNPNSDPLPREGTIDVEGEKFTVYQCGIGGDDVWSDNFDGIAPDPPNQHTWHNIDHGINSSAVFSNSQYEISTENDSVLLDEYFDSYVGEAASDAIIQANIKQIDPGDIYFAGLSLRFNPETDSGYGVIIISSGIASIGKRTNGVVEPLGSTIDIGPSVAIDCQVKFAAVGTNLYAKIWETGVQEPKEWQLEATDSDFSFGFAGVMLNTALPPDVLIPFARVAFDDVSLTTDMANNLCAYSFSPVSTTSGETGGSYSVDIISYPDCPVCEWEASSQDGWLTTSSSGYGFGTVDYEIEDNLTGAGRTGHITINNGLETFEIYQYGGAIWTETFDNNTLHNVWGFIDTFESGVDVYDNPPILSDGACYFDVRSTSGPADKHLSGYVDDTNREDAIIQAGFNAIDSGDQFLVYLGLRYDPITDSGYGFGITNWGHIWFAKRANGLAEPLVVKLLDTFNPEFCQLKFAAVGNKLFGKAWTTGTTEPSDWQLEFTDYSFTTGKAGIGAAAWPTGYPGTFEHSRGIFDNVRCFDTSTFWIASETSTGGEVPADANQTLTVGGSEVLVDSNSGENSIISIAETTDDTYRYTSGIFGGSFIDRQVKISSDLEDGQHKTVVKMHYTDEEIAGKNEGDLRLMYYNDVARSWRLAVSGNTSPPSDPEATFRLSAPPDLASAVLGDHGIDTVNNILWAVVDHYSDYSAIDPEAGGWALFNDGIMYFGDDDKIENTVTINSGGSYVWVSATPSTSAILYSNASWTGQLNFEEIVYGEDEFTVEVGYSVDGSTFVAGTISTTIIGDESGMERAYDIDTGADGQLTVSTGQYVALRVTNNSAKTFNLRTGGLRSFLNAPPQGEPDRDGDGTPDSLDNCINDPNKSEPGTCGCGKPDIPDCGGFSGMVYEDAEDGDTTGWVIYDTDPTGATVTNIFDPDRGNGAIALSGDGTGNGYQLRTSDGSLWNDSIRTVLQWSMNYSEFFIIYVQINTTDGMRYLSYRSQDPSPLGTGQCITYGLGSDAADDSWRTFTRDLANDLALAQPGNSLISVDSFLIRGSGRVDDIILMEEMPPTSPQTYEDAEDGTTTGWKVYDDNPAGSSMLNVYDIVKNSQVIALSGDSTDNGYQLCTASGALWVDSNRSVIEWSMNYSEFFRIYVQINTTDGKRYLNYLPTDTSSLGSDQSIKIGLGSDVADGTWRTFTRDLANDLALAQPGNSLISVDGFLIRGSGMVDDIILMEEMPPIPPQAYEDATDGLTDRWVVYDADPDVASILNVYDSAKASQVIELDGDGTGNGFQLRTSGGSLWKDSNRTVLEWSMNYSENFKIYVQLDTTAGMRYLSYRPQDASPLGTGQCITYGIGTNAADDTWRTFTRDLAADLALAQPDNSLISVDGFLIRGSGMVDDIIMMEY